jgi:hypothetical protein
VSHQVSLFYQCPCISLVLSTSSVPCGPAVLSSPPCAHVMWIHWRWFQSFPWHALESCVPPLCYTSSCVCVPPVSVFIQILYYTYSVWSSTTLPSFSSLDPPPWRLVLLFHNPRDP